MCCTIVAKTHLSTHRDFRWWAAIGIWTVLFGGLTDDTLRANPLSSLFPSRFQNAATASNSESAASRFPTAAGQHSPLSPIYWQQPLFFIPYQVNSHDAAVKQIAKVQLMFSQTGAHDWTLLQEAEPGVRGFSYHAPGDGEYWFGLRHLDRHGMPLGGEGVMPQMRIVVDTKLPEFSLQGSIDADKTIVIRYEATDSNLLHESIIIEARVPRGSGVNSEWQPLSIGPPDVSQPDRLVGRVRWSVPYDANEVEVRASIADRAGHRQLASTTIGLSGPALSMPEERRQQFSTGGNGLQLPGAQPPTRDPERTRLGQTDPFLRGDATPSPPENPANDRLSQEWPSNNHLSQNDSFANNSFAKSSIAGSQSLVNPHVSGDWNFEGHTAVQNPYTRPTDDESHSRRTPVRFAVDGHKDTDSGQNSSGSQRSEGFGPMTSGNLAADGWSSNSELPVGEQVRMVNSRTFDVEYDLDAVGPWGVAKVELWGTTDGGAGWQNYGTDPDNRSPFRVTVPDAGKYGFRIVVDGANGAASPRPRPGDSPELLVVVDLQPPQAELLAAEVGNGNLADHLLIRWRAEDSNLERRPVSLLYSSLPDGPWSTIATGLENTGSYIWRIERHVPERFYVRLEVRDTAGNLTAVQSPQPLSLNRPQPTGRLRNVRPVTSQPGT